MYKIQRQNVKLIFPAITERVSTIVFDLFLMQVFFIDHPHCLTTFIDPRLPLPDQEFTYTTPTQSIPTNRRVQSYSEVGGQLYTHTHLMGYKFCCLLSVSWETVNG